MKFEYKYIHQGEIQSNDEFFGEMNELGQEGWELVTYIYGDSQDVAIFIRRIKIK